MEEEEASDDEAQRTCEHVWCHYVVGEDVVYWGVMEDKFCKGEGSYTHEEGGDGGVEEHV